MHTAGKSCFWEISGKRGFLSGKRNSLKQTGAHQGPIDLESVKEERNQKYRRWLYRVMAIWPFFVVTDQGLSERLSFKDRF